MNKFALLTAPFLCMGAAALFADAYNEHSAAGNAFGQQSSGLLAAHDQNGQNGQGKKNGNGNGGFQTGDRQMGQITPEAEPRVENWCDPFLTAEFIYWKAAEDNIHFAFTGANEGTTGSPSRGNVHGPNADFEPGFKLGFGLRFKHDGWDLYGNWTWLAEFNDHGRAETSDAGNSAAITTLSSIAQSADGAPANLSTQYQFETGHAHWSLKFNALDLELGRNFYISPYLTLRPHFGLKFGWIDQDYHAKYKGGLNATGDTGSLDSSRRKARIEQDFFGVGIRTGLDTVWYFARHWGIYGDFALSAMWSDFHTKRKDTAADAVNPKTTADNYHDKVITLTEVLELGLGFRYDTTFFIGDYAFYLQAGWEEQIWFNQNQFLDNISNRTGNLTMHGLTVKAGLMF